MPHTSKNDSKSIFIQNGGVITSSPLALYGFDPGVVKERENTNGPKRMAAMPPNHNSLIFIHNNGMPLSCFRFPSLNLNTCHISIIYDIFRECFLY